MSEQYIELQAAFVAEHGIESWHRSKDHRSRRKRASWLGKHLGRL